MKLTGVIATRVGNALPDDQCVVTRSQKAPWIKGDDLRLSRADGAAVPELQRHRGVGHHARELGGKPGGPGSLGGSECSRGPKTKPRVADEPERSSKAPA